MTDDDANDTLSGNEIRSALAEATLAGKVRQLFIKHESEWIKRASWQRLKQELTDKPNLYQYALDVTNNMAWIEEASTILGDSKPWFIHPAGMMGLVGDKHAGCACNRDLTLDELKALRPANGISDEKLQGYLDAFNKSFDDFSVKTCVEKANFLAQVFHESGSLFYTQELGGNTQPYNPWYGRGFIQITFRVNYQAYGEYVGEDVTSSAINRDKLTVAPHIVRSAYWYIYVSKPACGIAFKKDDLLYGSFLINGGLTHYIDRLRKVNLALNKFGSPDEFVKNHNGKYRFEESEIYNLRRGALAWGIWNDTASNKPGTNNEPMAALKGYKRFLTLLQSQPFTQEESDRIWYGRTCGDWKAFAEERILSLE